MLSFCVFATPADRLAPSAALRFEVFIERKCMKKRFVNLILAGCMAASLLYGCGDVGAGEGAGNAESATSEADAGGSGSADTDAGAEVADGTEAGNGVQTAAYQYEQELNIIDDNYRNYYEIFVYSFYDTDGDGIGDLNGVTEKLDYIQDLGFNGIWLMPIMPSTSYHKYDVVDYCDIDEEYGTLDDFKTLLDEAHARGIRVTIDFVMNHSSSENAWFKEACAYLKTLGEDEEPDASVCPYVDYYHFSKEAKDGYCVVTGTDWYYEAQFDYKMPDLNLACEALRAEFEQIADFWIDLGVDGFRMDAALHYEENDTSFNTEVMNWFYNYCLSKNPDFYMVSEVWAAKSTIADYYGSLTPSMFNFDVSSAEGVIVKTVRSGSNASKFVDAMIDYQTTYGAQNPDYIDAPFLTNHDQVRVANNLTGDTNNLKMAAGLLLTMNGSPFVYYGEEIGMKSTGQQDENKRLPMVWSKTDSTGMTAGPAGCDQDFEAAKAGVDAQEEDETSLLNFYKRALRIRNENPEIARGTVEKVKELCSGAQAAVTKTYEGSVIGIVYNISAEEAAKIDLSGTVLEGMSIRGYLSATGEEVTLDGQSLHMPADTICILKN
jgi:glycosidase